MSELVKCKDKLPGEEVVGDTILYLLYLNIDNWTPSIPPSSYTKEKIGAHDLFLKVADTLQLTPMQLLLHAEDGTHSAFEVVYYTVLSNLWQEQLICSEIPVVNMNNQKVALASAGWVHLMSTGVIDE